MKQGNMMQSNSDGVPGQGNSMCKSPKGGNNLGCSSDWSSWHRVYRWQKRRWECQEGPGYAGVCRLWRAGTYLVQMTRSNVYLKIVLAAV